jgi:hypothetical protein
MWTVEGMKWFSDGVIDGSVQEGIRLSMNWRQSEGCNPYRVKMLNFQLTLIWERAVGRCAA